MLRGRWIKQVIPRCGVVKNHPSPSITVSREAIPSEGEPFRDLSELSSTTSQQLSSTRCFPYTHPYEVHKSTGSPSATVHRQMDDNVHIIFTFSKLAAYIR